MGAQWEFIVSQPNGQDAQSKKTVRKAAMRAFRRNQRQERMQQFQKQKPGSSSPESDESGERPTKGKRLSVLKAEFVEAKRGVDGVPMPDRASEHLELDTLDTSANGGEDSKDSPETYLTGQDLDSQLAVRSSFPTGQVSPNVYELFRRFLTTSPQADLQYIKSQSHIQSEWSCHALKDPVGYGTRFSYDNPTLYHRGETLWLSNDRDASPDSHFTVNMTNETRHKKASAKMISLQENSSPDNPGAEILAAIHALSSLTTHHSATLPFNTKCSVIEQRLHSLAITLPCTNPENYMFEAARLATLLCIGSTSHHFPPSSPLFQTLLFHLTAIVTQINDAHFMCGPAEFRRKDVEMMLWVGFVVGVFADEKNWIEQLLSSAIVFLGLEKAGDVEDVLRSYFWTDGMQEMECVGFWQGVKSESPQAGLFDEMEVFGEVGVGST